MDGGRILEVDPIQPAECCQWEKHSAWAAGWMVVPLIEGKGWGRNKFIASLFCVSLPQRVNSRVHFLMTAYWDYSGDVKLLFHWSHFISTILICWGFCLPGQIFSLPQWGYGFGSIFSIIHFALLWIVLAWLYPFYFFSMLFFNNSVKVLYLY